MSLSLVTAAAVRPVSLAEVKLDLRVDVGDEDTLIESLIRAATDYAEMFTGRALITQTWDWKLDGFPCGDLVLPKAPVASITSVTYLDTTGASTTWSSSLYQTDLPTGPEAGPARIAPAYLQIYPQTRAVFNAVTVRFVAGYGASGETVPAGLLQGIKQLVKHWYGEGRQPIVVGAGITMTAVPLTIDALLYPYKVC